MKKINDWFCAGLIAGVIGGAALNLYCLVLILSGVPFEPYWRAMGGLFYNKQLLLSWPAQVHGVIDSIGVSGANGILTCLIIKYTGAKYFYIKSVILSAIGAYFLFLAVYPQTGLGKNNPYTPWVALSGHTVFLGLLTGYILKKIYSFNTEPVARRQTGSEKKTPPAKVIPESETPVTDKNSTILMNKTHFRKPKK